MKIKTIAGPALILIGVLLLLNPGQSFGVGTIFTYFWPSLFMIPLGLVFHYVYFTSSDRNLIGLLVPGGVLDTPGIVCQIAMLFAGRFYLWPGFIMAAAVGLFELYWFGTRNRYLLIPILILTGLSLMFFFVFSLGSLLSLSIYGQPAMAVALIVIGALVLFLRKKQA